MKRYFRTISMLVAAFFAVTEAMADDYPTISPSATFTDSEGTEEEGTTFSGSAPITAHFHANAENTSGWNATYEWRFTKENSESAYLVRYEEDTEFTFTDSGSHRIVLYATFTQGTDSVKYTEEYWEDAEPITVTVSESSLVMPNAFSPNGDGINDIYRAKEGYKSIVEFKATIFNRWGQKIYSWDDPAGGWDGTFHGKDVAQGVYFVLVEAKGADGRKYHIKRDVNLLRGYTETSGASTE